MTPTTQTCARKPPPRADLPYAVRGEGPQSLALQSVADRLSFGQLPVKIRRPLLLAARARRLMGCLNLPHGGLRDGGVVGAVGDQHQRDPLIAQAPSPV